jgi:hypothetical protein
LSAQGGNRELNGKKKLKNEIEKKKKRGSQRIKNQVKQWSPGQMDYSDPRSKDQSQTVHNICAPIFFVCLSIDYGGTIKKKSFKLSCLPDKFLLLSLSYLEST